MKNPSTVYPNRSSLGQDDVYTHTKFVKCSYKFAVSKVTKVVPSVTLRSKTPWLWVVLSV